MIARRAVPGLLALALFGAIAAPANAATISGLDTNLDAPPNNDGVCTLRDAVEIHNDSSTAGNDAGCSVSGDLTMGDDTIELQSGTTYELATGSADNMNLTGDLDISVAGGGLTIAGVDGAPATIDANSFDRAVNVISAADGVPLTLSDLIVTGGNVSDPGGGIRASGDLVLDDSRVTANQAPGGIGTPGGGIYQEGGSFSSLTLIDSSVDTNTSASAGGGIALNEASLTASGDSHIDDNISNGGGGGGGIAQTGSTGAVTLNAGVTVERNKAVGFGGGLYVGGTGAPLTITGASVSDNDVTEDGSTIARGAAIIFLGDSAVTVTGSEIEGNDSVADNAAPALYLDSSGTIAINSSSISTNTATGQNDTVGNDIVSGAGLALGGSGAATITDSTVATNSSVGADSGDAIQGGGINNLGAGMLTIDGTTISGNSVASGPASSRGGPALFNFSASAPTKIINSTFQGNNAGTGAGGAIHIDLGTQPLTIVHSTFAGNTAGSQGSAINVFGTGTTTLRGTVFDQPEASTCFFSGTLVANAYNVDQGESCVGPDPGNLDNDFENTDATLGNLADEGGPTETMRLTGPSELIDAVPSSTECNDLDGTTDLLLDQRDAPRPFDSDGDSTAGCEPGAYELVICDGPPAIVGSPGDDSGAAALVGTPGDDVIHGLGGNDEINGLGGLDRLCGGEGNDTMSAGGEDDSVDDLDGQDGTDKVTYADLPPGASVIANLETGLASGPAGSVGLDNITGFEQMVGSGGGDILTGDLNDNLLEAGGGNDVLDGKMGGDTLNGEGGTNTASFTENVGVNANLFSGSATGQGGDTLLNIQNLTGSPVGDALIGDGNANELRGGTGADDLTGNGGSDMVFGDPGADELFLRDGVGDTGDCGLDSDVDAVQADQAGVDTLTNCGSPDLIDFLTPPPSAPPASPPAAGPTGQRAAALKRCAKIKNKKKKKKCKRRARRLPV